MALNFSSIEAFIAENQGRMKDKSLLRHERFQLLQGLRDKLHRSLNDYLHFESELSSLVVERIETARTYEELLKCHKRAVAGIERFFVEEDTVVDVHDLFRIVRDCITVQVLKLVEEEMVAEGYGHPPTNYVWVGLGSEGRDEQTLMTDQDNMIAYSDAGEEGDRYFATFAKKAVDGLYEAGFERCKGGVMASTEKWRGSLTDWKKRIEQRIVYEEGIFESLDVIILTDARTVAGDKSLLVQLLHWFFGFLTKNKMVMKDFYTSAVLMPTALSFFGKFKTEKSGEFTDMLNIKLLGWAPLILAVRMVAITNGIFETNTLGRIRRLGRKNVIKKDMEEDLLTAYLTFVRFRIMNQIANRDGNLAAMNHLRPDMLGTDEQAKLRKAMRTVETFQKYIKDTLLFGQSLV